MQFDLHFVAIECNMYLCILKYYYLFFMYFEKKAIDRYIDILRVILRKKNASKIVELEVCAPSLRSYDKTMVKVV